MIPDITLFPKHTLTKEKISEIDLWLESISGEWQGGQELWEKHKKVYIAQGDRIFVIQNMQDFGGSGKSPMFCFYPSSLNSFNEEKDDYCSFISSALNLSHTSVFTASVETNAEEEATTVFIRLVLVLAKKIEANLTLVRGCKSNCGSNNRAYVEDLIPATCRRLRYQPENKSENARDELLYVMNIQDLENWINRIEASPKNSE